MNSNVLIRQLKEYNHCAAGHLSPNSVKSSSGNKSAVRHFGARGTSVPLVLRLAPVGPGKTSCWSSPAVQVIIGWQWSFLRQGKAELGKWVVAWGREDWTWKADAGSACNLILNTILGCWGQHGLPQFCTHSIEKWKFFPLSSTALKQTGLIWCASSSRNLTWQSCVSSKNSWSLWKIVLSWWAVCIWLTSQVNGLRGYIMLDDLLLGKDASSSVKTNCSKDLEIPDGKTPDPVEELPQCFIQLNEEAEGDATLASSRYWVVYNSVKCKHCNTRMIPLQVPCMEVSSKLQPAGTLHSTLQPLFFPADLLRNSHWQ